MPPSTNLLVKCPVCQRQYRWNPEFAHQRFRCKCKAVFLMPVRIPEGMGTVTATLAAPPPVGPEGQAADGQEALPYLTEAEPEPQRGTIELEPSPPRPAAVRPAPAAPKAKSEAKTVNSGVDESKTPRAPADVAFDGDDAGYEVNEPVAPPPPRPIDDEALRFMSRAPSAVEKALAEPPPEKPPSFLLEEVLPWTLTGGGALFTLGIWALYLGTTHVRGLGAGVMLLVLQLLVFLPLTLAATMATASMMNVGFGEIVPVLTKLLMVTLGPGGVADVLVLGLFHYDYEIFWCIGISFLIYMILCGACLALLFRLNLNETALTVAIFSFPRIGLLLLLMGLFPEYFRIGAP